MKFIDMHCDTISAIHHNVKQGNHMELRENSLHIDLMKLKHSNYMAQNFAVFIQKSRSENPLEDALSMIDLFYQELEKNKDLIAYAGSYSDILANEKAGKMSALLTLEEGAMIKGSLSNLRNLYRLGARMMTLTWNFENELASPNSNYTKFEHPDPTVPFTSWGLTECGFEVVSEMERLGMIIDVSHLSDAGFYDVCSVAKRPFVASHSNARNVSCHVRNLSDDMIRKLSEHGGVMGINFYPDFLAHPTNPEKNKGKLSEVIAHIKYIEKIGGIDCIGLGSDFDGIEGNEDLPDASAMTKLYDALHKEGYSDDKIEKIFSGNVLRVYQDILR